MFRLSTRSQYSLKAMLDLSLAGGNRAVSGRTIAQRQGIPAPFLEKILLDLRREGLVVSHRGAQGGVSLGTTAGVDPGVGNFFGGGGIPDVPGTPAPTGDGLGDPRSLATAERVV